FSSMTYVVTANAGDTEVLIALAATLPRQIDMTNQVHQLTSGWNDVLALWARIGGGARSMRPEPGPNFHRPLEVRPLLPPRGGTRPRLRVYRRSAGSRARQATRPGAGTRSQWAR